MSLARTHLMTWKSFPADDVTFLGMDIWTDFICGCFGGIAGTVAGHPTDTIKVLQQLHGSKMSARLCIEHLIKQHGVRGLFKGMSSPLATSAVVNAIFFGVYGNTLKLLTSVSNSGQNKSPTLSQVYLAGALSGTIQLMVSCPAELAKIQLQKDISDTHSKSSTSKNAGGKKLIKFDQLKGPLHFLRIQYTSHGLKGWYKGLLPMFLRDPLTWGLYMVIYEQILRKGKEYQLSSLAQCLLPLLAGGVTGVVSWSAALPCDVVKSRIQGDCLVNPRYNGTLHCIKISYAEEGLQVFTRGFGPLALRAFIVNAATFIVYQSMLNHISGQ